MQIIKISEPLTRTPSTNSSTINWIREILRPPTTYCRIPGAAQNQQAGPVQPNLYHPCHHCLLLVSENWRYDIKTIDWAAMNVAPNADHYSAQISMARIFCPGQ